jgi:hypothetical protein
MQTACNMQHVRQYNLVSEYYHRRNFEHNFIKNKNNLLKTFQVWRHKYAWPFHTPVDPVKLMLPDYFEIIKCPMDMTLIKKRLDGLNYKTAKTCIQDFDTMFQNCYTYNRPTEDVTIMAKKVQEFLHNKLKNMPPVEVILEVRVSF